MTRSDSESISGDNPETVPTGAAPAPALLTHYRRYAIAHALSLAAGVISFPITTRLLTSAEFGVLGYWDAWVLLLTAILKLGAGDTMMRFYPHGGDAMARVRHATNFVLLPTLLGVAGWAIAAAALTGSALAGWMAHPLLAFIAATLAGLQMMISHALWVMSTREYSGLSASMMVVWRFLTVALTLGTLWFFWASAVGAMTGRIVAAALVAAGLWWWVLRHLRFSWRSLDAPYAREGFAYGLPLALKEISSVVLAFIDRLMLVWLLGDFAIVGLYSIGFGLAMYVDQLISTALYQAWTPFANRLYATGGAEAVRAAKRRLLRPLVYLCVGLGCGIWMVSADFVVLLAGHAKAEAAPVFLYASLGLLTLPILSISSMGLLLERKSGTLLLLTMGAALTNVVLNLLLIPRYGMMGAVGATCFSQIGLQLACYVYCPVVLRCVPEAGVLIRAAVAALLCLTVWHVAAPLAGIDHVLLRCLLATGVMLLAYALPIWCADRELRRLLKPAFRLGPAL